MGWLTKGSDPKVEFRAPRTTQAEAETVPSSGQDSWGGVGLTVVDETHKFNGFVDTYSAWLDAAREKLSATLYMDEENTPPDTSLSGSVIQVTFNRDFTWAEREHFYRWVRDSLHPGVENPVDSYVFKRPNKLLVWSTWDSREVAEEIQGFVAKEYLNIFPKAVKTIYPEVRV